MPFPPMHATRARVASWSGSDDCPRETRLDYFSGPGLLEWMMGFPAAWTDMRRRPHGEGGV